MTTITLRALCGECKLIMENGVRRVGLISGIALIVIGALLLVENLYGSFSLWDLLLKYWPLVLILLGARSLYRYFTYKPEAR